MDFTYSAYSAMIDSLKKNGYSFSDYHTCHKYDKCVILRHDIDYSINKAVKLAELEYSLGVKSNYFVLISTPFYNVISRDIWGKLDLISNRGHNIGLHFDEKNYSNDYYRDNGGVKNVILKETKILEEILGRKVNSISMHRPSKETLDADYDFGNIVNSYGKIFFKEYKYVSDSRRNWRENLEEIIESGNFNKLHILTHAFWYNSQEESIKDSIYKFIDSAANERYDILNDNIRNLQGIIGKNEI